MAVQKWQAIDGTLFDTQAQAVAYEVNIVRRKNVVELLRQFDMSPMVRESLATFIVDNRVALALATR